MKQQTIVGGMVTGIAIASLWSTTRLDLGLHPILTGIGIAASVAGVIGGLMVVFVEERRASGRPDRIDQKPHTGRSQEGEPR